MHKTRPLATTALAALLALAVLALAARPAYGRGYTLNWEANGSTFFDKFNFMTNDDYSHGFVNYVNRTYAQGTSSLSPSLSLSLACSESVIFCALDQGTCE
jgi:hypothetical protein